MVKLSVNINKIATIRNSRGGNIPNLTKSVIDIQNFGCHGITLHPRPDERHIKYEDVYKIRPLIFDNVELNIEGNPSDKFMNMVLDVKPHQVTLVPDSYDAITSNSGWDIKNNYEFLLNKIKLLKKNNIRTSIFLDPNHNSIKYAHKIGVDRIELYTGPFSVRYDKHDPNCINDYIKTAKKAIQYNIPINAGHDLNLNNIDFLIKNVPGIVELSIGHALISDSLYMGLENTIQIYIRKIYEAKKKIS